jgi:hypothetical protein
MTHPLEIIPARKQLFIVLLAASLALSIIMGVVGDKLNTPAAPNGIVSFELAGSTQKARTILDSWDAQVRVYAGFIQGLDFLYLCVYSTTIALGCLLAGEVIYSRHWPLAGLSKPLAWGLWLAAAFDAIENVALVILLFGSIQAPWPQVAVACAVLKFGLLILGLVYLLYGLVLNLLPKANKSLVINKK